MSRWVAGWVGGQGSKCASVTEEDSKSLRECAKCAALVADQIGHVKTDFTAAHLIPMCAPNRCVLSAARVAFACLQLLAMCSRVH